MQEVIEMKVCGFQGTEKSVAKNATKAGEGISLHGGRGGEVEGGWGGDWIKRGSGQGNRSCGGADPRIGVVGYNDDSLEGD